MITIIIMRGSLTSAMHNVRMHARAHNDVTDAGRRCALSTRHRHMGGIRLTRTSIFLHIAFARNLALGHRTDTMTAFSVKLFS